MSRNQCLSIESRRKLDFVKKHFLPKDVLDQMISLNEKMFPFEIGIPYSMIQSVLSSLSLSFFLFRSFSLWNVSYANYTPFIMVRRENCSCWLKWHFYRFQIKRFFSSVFCNYIPHFSRTMHLKVIEYPFRRLKHNKIRLLSAYFPIYVQKL